jgi:hypothetical protein
MVVDRLLYRFWDIGTNEDNMLTVWICLLPLWIYFLRKNEKPTSEGRTAKMWKELKLQAWLVVWFIVLPGIVLVILLDIIDLIF